MLENNKKINNENNENNVSSTFLDKDKKFILENDVEITKKLDISNKTLFSLAESGEFNLGRIAGKIIINIPQLLSFLDRYHFVGIENEDDEIAIDSKGKIKAKLTYVKEKHTSIPTLKPIEFYANELGMDKRNFIRHCDIGTFYHYRIGTSYKMSNEDWEKSLKKITETNLKSQRGTTKKKGRKFEIEKKIHEMNLRKQQEE